MLYIDLAGGEAGDQRLHPQPGVKDLSLLAKPKWLLPDVHLPTGKPFISHRTAGC